MPTYPDRRTRFKGAAQWTVQPGNGRGDNAFPVSAPVSDLMKRGMAPRDAFRVATTEDVNLLRAQAEAKAIAKAQKESPSGSSDTSDIRKGASLLEASIAPGESEGGSTTASEYCAAIEGQQSMQPCPVTQPHALSTVGSSAKAIVGDLLASE